ncbi:hypothetical protein WICPIJ_000809 [Wickerhamomyces pijperi]|uniref:histone deacetylase n=1 Tax=Wickerhamomyces pijperi TaxID=599730 RepID=A0A9P8QC49_WICPI|nr:hypothetical protein WICPIJ_000809 [Wickerhamomyces pijperi]
MTSIQSATKQSQLPKLRKVAIAGFHDFEVALSSLVPSNIDRSFEVHKLLKSYNEIFSKLELLSMYFATKDELCKFHDRSFIETLMRNRKCEDLTVVRSEVLEIIDKHSTMNQNQYEDEEDLSNRDLETYGLKYDCPIFTHLPQYIKSVAGSSLTAARFILKTQGETSETEETPQCISINWNGGRHHSKKSHASGFCYVNDITLAILELRRKFDKVAYIDLDLHHGDGVENAFKFSDKVLTISMHRKEMGFFPGTGGLDDQGVGKGKGWTVNLPLMHGLSDKSLLFVITEIVVPVLKESGVECLVIQCGGDGLGSDDYKEWNLSIKGFGEAVDQLLLLGLPTVLLGGGGYNNSQMARLYTYLTAVAIGKKDYQFDILPEAGTLDADDTDGQYEFWNVQGLKMIDDNDETYLRNLKTCILSRFNS